MNDFSIDIETLGTTPYSVILSIGVQGFNRHNGLMDDGFEIVVNAEDCVAKGLRMDPSTVLWWLQQSDEARKVFAPSGGATLHYALDQLNEYFKREKFSKNSCIWGNGAGFDINLLEDAYRVTPGVPCPWHFWQSRDVRTVVDIAGLDKKAYRHEGVHHTALADARNQARMVIDGVAQLKQTT